MKQLTNRTILNLPISTSIIHYLSSDPIVPSISKLFSIHQSTSTSIKPSNLRRSRQVNATFSFVTPLPISFPYQIPQTHLNSESKPESVSLDEIERYLSEFEPNPNHEIQPSTTSISEEFPTPLGFTSEHRTKLFQSLSPELLSISYKSIQDCLPDLNIGRHETSEERIELIKVLSGELVLGRLPEGPDGSDHQQVNDQDLIKQKGFGPWSLAYAGHQFGFFAGQLGDGRAISILSTPTTESVLNKAFNLTQIPSTHQIKPKLEIQLKGAGRTPFSRFADGLAVLRSSIREYLGTEFCHSLYEFPTSRSMSLISLSNLNVQRERIESGAIVGRLAPNWIRIGNFELFRFREDWKTLMDLIGFVGVHVFGFSKDEKDLGLKVFREIMIRNAMMVAAWQAWGFMHGVINTDNVSILGITIDFGPYAFMDIYDPNHICNKSDDMGRYDFKSQPEMIKFSLKKLGDSFNEYIGFETLKEDYHDQEFVGLMNDDLEIKKKFKEIGKIEVAKVLDEFNEIYQHQYESIMNKRLGLSELKPTDHLEIIKPLLELMKDKLDYSITIKTLNRLPNLENLNPEEYEKELNSFITKLSTPPFSNQNQTEDFELWKDWIEKFMKRKQENPEIFRDINPNFILRQWVLEEVIKDPELLNPILGLINGEIDDHDVDLQRFFGVGDRNLIGFQCSCSS